MGIKVEAKAEVVKTNKQQKHRRISKRAKAGGKRPPKKLKRLIFMLCM